MGIPSSPWLERILPARDNGMAEEYLPLGLELRQYTGLRFGRLERNLAPLPQSEQVTFVIPREPKSRGPLLLLKLLDPDIIVSQTVSIKNYFS